MGLSFLCWSSIFILLILCSAYPWNLWRSCLKVALNTRESIDMGREAMLVSKLKTLRWSAMVLGTANSLVFVVGSYFLVLAFPSCDCGLLVMLVAVSILAALRIGTMVQTGFAQEATAKTILEKPPADSSDIGEDASRPETRVCFLRQCCSCFWNVACFYVIKSYISTVADNDETSCSCISDTCLVDLMQMIRPLLSHWKTHSGDIEQGRCLQCH